MIDRECRRLFAEQVRHFAAGVVTVDEYEARTDDMAIASHDDGVAAVWRAVWCCYDDFRTKRLRGDWRLTLEGRREIALCILFLYSDAEHAWPIDQPCVIEEIAVSVGETLIRAFTLGLLRDPFRHHYERRWQKRERRMRSVGDLDCWPFLRRAELDAARRVPRLLAGSPR